MKAGEPTRRSDTSTSDDTRSARGSWTGRSVAAQQYRLGSSDSNNWNRQLVWVFERDGQIYVAEIGFPEFPDDSVFAQPAGPINRSLTGLDPVDLLDDIRFFE